MSVERFVAYAADFEKNCADGAAEKIKAWMRDHGEGLDFTYSPGSAGAACRESGSLRR